MASEILLGDEAVALGAIHAGVTASYAYPGTPATEITEFLQARARRYGGPPAAWCANEKTAYEAALGVSFAGRRALVSMKHVGLNVAADAFVNSALLPLGGGLVLAVADDPGMHSSQNEQDSRYYADFSRVPCFEPADQQEAYDMTREAFDLSERFRVPVVVRLVTRLAHSRARVECGAPRGENPPAKPSDREGWILLPANARRGWRALLEKQPALSEASESSSYNRLDMGGGGRSLGVITTGVAGSYLAEASAELAAMPPHLHLGLYPVPLAKLRRLAAAVDRILVLEDGYPFVERRLRGLLPPPLEIMGKESGQLPAAGELDPDVVRAALGLPRAGDGVTPDAALPARPPQLCRWCPHGDSYRAVKKALAGFGAAAVTADIGCYTLGALPPYSAIESCVCMGASIGMARGASEAGLGPVIAVIGDSTFFHSGIPALLDAAANDVDMTVLILDNGTVGMTGAQPTVAPASTLESVVRGVGVAPQHCHVVALHPRRTEEVAALLRRELEHRGLSVVIGRRECIESAKKRKRVA